jgi:hypothetical protein
MMVARQEIRARGERKEVAMVYFGWIPEECFKDCFKAWKKRKNTCIAAERSTVQVTNYD